MKIVTSTQLVTSTFGFDGTTRMYELIQQHEEDVRHAVERINNAGGPEYVIEVQPQIIRDNTINGSRHIMFATRIVTGVDAI